MRTVVCVGALLLAGGCAAVDEQGDADQEQMALSEAQLAGGCHWDCPKCHPGEVCALLPCRLECPPAHKPCGDALCGPQQTCCNESCGICVAEGETCTQQICSSGGEVCGDSVCGEGEYCCNESCGICAPLDGACTQQLCEPELEPCGDVLCPAGEVCCNPSCGLCAPPDVFCTQQSC